MTKATTTESSLTKLPSYIPKTGKEVGDEFISSLTSPTSEIDKLDESTRPYLDVRTGIGGYGEGKTMGAISRGLKEKAFDNPLLYKQIEEFTSPVGNYATTKAKEYKEDFNIGNVDVDLKTSTIGNIKLARQKAIKDVEDFSDPSSPIASTFRKNIGEDKYKEYTKDLQQVEDYKQSFKNGEDNNFAYETSGLRGILSSSLLNAPTNWATGGRFNAYQEAITSAEAEGVTGLTDYGSYYGGMVSTELLGGLLTAGASRLLATKGLVELGMGVKGVTGGNLVKMGNTISRIEKSSPYLYGATVDNGMYAALQYGVDSTFASPHSTQDFVNNLVMGVATAGAFKAASLPFVKATEKDLVNLNKAIEKEIVENGAKDVPQAIDNLSTTHTFEDGVTLGEKINGYKEANPINPDKDLQWEEVSSTYARDKKVAISDRAAKKYAHVVTTLNNEIKEGDEVVEGMAYGSMSTRDKISMVKKDIENNLSGKDVVSGKDADDAIEDAFKKNGLEYKDKFKIADDIEDEVDEAFYNKKANPTLIDSSEDMEGVGKALGKEKVFSSKDISGLRYANDSGELDLNKLNDIANENGVKIDTNKLYNPTIAGTTAKPTINKDYVTSILDEVELNYSGYSKVKNTILKKGKEGVTKIKNTLLKIVRQESGESYSKKFINSKGESVDFEDLSSSDINKLIGKGKVDVGEFNRSTESILRNALSDTSIKGSAVEKLIKKFLPQLNTLNKEMDEIATRLKTTLSNSEKLKLTKLRNAKNLQIQKIRDEFKGKLDFKDSKISSLKTKAKETINFVRYVKDSIDLASEGYKGQIPQSQLVTIKNKFKSKINPNTTVKRGIEIMEQLNRELYQANFKLLESKADGLVARINKRLKSKKLKANISLDTREEIIHAFSQFNNGRVKGDIDGMREAVARLKSLYDNGRNIFKENKLIEKEATKQLLIGLDEELAKKGETMLKMRLANSSETGISFKWGGDSVLRFAESNIPAYLQIQRLFRNMGEVGKQLEEVFLGRLQKAQNEYMKMRRNINDVVVPKIILNGAKAMGMSEDEASISIAHWLRSGSQYGHENNLFADVVFKKNSSGKYRPIVVRNQDEFIDSNKLLIDSGEIVHFGSTIHPELKERILQDLYREVEEAIRSNQKLAEGIAELRLHFKNSGERTGKIVEKVFNKPWESIPDYFPIIKRGKGGIESALEAQGEFQEYTKASLQDGFLNPRVAPGVNQMVSMELGLAEIVSSHITTAGWWNNMVEPLLEYDAVFRKLSQGRAGLTTKEEVRKLKPENAGDILALVGGDSKDMDEFIGKGNALMSAETSSFFRQYFAMVATNGRSLSKGDDMGVKVVNSLVKYSNTIYLSGPWTAAKQPMNTGDIFLQAGPLNGGSGFKASFNTNNSTLALDESAALMERQASYISKEGKGKSLYLQGGKSWLGKGIDNVGEVNDAIGGNTVKLVDGAMSTRAWLAGVSKYLDENNLFHKAGENFNLQEIKNKILALDGGEEIWKDVVRSGDNIMNRVMGSNNLVEKAIGSGSILSKLSLIFQRSGLNHVLATLDILAEKWGSGNTLLDKVNKTKASAATAFLASAFAYGYSRAVSKAKLESQVAMGVISREDADKTRMPIAGVEIKDPSFEELIAVEMWEYIKANTIAPGLSFDLTMGAAPAITTFTTAVKAPTTSRQLEEFAYGVGKLAVNSTYVDLLRTVVSKTGVGLVQVDADTYDTAAKQIIEMTKDSGVDIIQTPQFPGLVDYQIKINKAKEEKAKLEKPIKEFESNFIKSLSKKYGKSISDDDLRKELSDNVGKLPNIIKGGKMTANSFKSLKAKIILDNAKSNGERDMMLSGMDAEIIYEVDLLPMIKSKGINSIGPRLEELMKKKVIKSTGGIKKIKELLQKDGYVK